MSWEVTVAVLIAAAIHAGWNALVKRGRDPLLETTLVHASVAVPAIVAVALLPLPGPDAALCLAASTVVHCVYYHALAAAYRSGDLSFAYPIMRGSAPMFTALLGVALLGEQPPLAGWLGIAAVCAGVLAIGLASARAAPSAWSYVAWLALVEGPAMAAVVAIGRGRELVAYARERGLQPMAAGVASMLAYGIALWAMTRAPVALVAALRETSVLFALVIARVLLGERFGPARWAGAASIVAGVVALRLA